MVSRDANQLVDAADDIVEAGHDQRIEAHGAPLSLHMHALWIAQAPIAVGEPPGDQAMAVDFRVQAAILAQAAARHESFIAETHEINGASRHREYHLVGIAR